MRPMESNGFAMDMAPGLPTSETGRVAFVNSIKSGSKPAPVVRKEFPETWIWTSISRFDIGV
jgi:hypothetical protein